MTIKLHFMLLIACWVMSACSSGAVVFAPTAPPPDLSPLAYTHPSGAFTLAVPRNWAVYEQHLTSLASAAFSPPDTADPPLSVAVLNLGRELDTDAFRDVINQYQTQIRQDVARYTEHDREAMGDGSWRLTGLRRTPGGVTVQVNTFLQRAGSSLAVIEVLMPADPATFRQLETVVNTFTLNDASGLEPAQLSVLTAASSSAVKAIHVASWSTTEGVFFITGEVANYSGVPLAAVPVRAVIRNQDGLVVAEAADVTMGHAIAPGGFAPFSLRFGQGQPARTDQFELILGGGDWQPTTQDTLVEQGVLSWTDESTFTEDSRLIISGTVTNEGDATVGGLRAVVTVFADNEDVIAAGFVEVTPSLLGTGETTDFQVVIPEMGGQPANYIVTVQGLA